jgi:hypothetical protein
MQYTEGYRSTRSFEQGYHGVSHEFICVLIKSQDVYGAQCFPINENLHSKESLIAVGYIDLMENANAEIK